MIDSGSSSVRLSGIARIDGKLGADVITGSATADTILGGFGDDTLNGGAGNDVFLFSGETDGFDVISGDAGTDTIQAAADNTVIGIKSFSTLEVITAAGFSGVSISGSDAADTLNFSTLTLTGIARINGGAGNDVITGSTAAAAFVGGEGDDTLGRVDKGFQP